MAVINCPKCGTESQFVITQEIYQGPYRCWKCKELLNIRIENGVLKSCVPTGKKD